MPETRESNGNGEPVSQTNVDNKLTHGVRSKRKICSSFGPESVDLWAATEILQDTFTFLWTLKNFSTFNEEVKSPIFRGGPKSGHYWQLKMNPKKKCGDVEYFSVHLILASFGDGAATSDRIVKVRFQISLLDPSGHPLTQRGSSIMDVYSFRKNGVCGFDKFLPHVDLNTAAGNYIEDDKVNIHCCIWIEGDLKHQVGNGGATNNLVPEEEKMIKRKKALEIDFKALLANGLHADIALSTATRTFMCHKSILSCRSNVFEKMFEVDMLESRNNTIEIKDFDEDTVLGMLEYIYCGDLHNLTGKAPDLMQIAEKYNLPGLKEECENVIVDNLSIENSAEFLVMASTYRATFLKTKVIEFINRNKDEIKQTKAFQKMASANSSIFIELYLSQ